MLATIKPKTGKRLAHVHSHSNKKEFTIFMKNLASIYPHAEKKIVMLGIIFRGTFRL